MLNKFSKAILIAGLAVAAFSNVALSQTTTVAQGRFFTTDGKQVTFFNLTMGDSLHKYQASQGGSFMTVAANNTVRIEQQTGTEALKWGVSLGLSGLAGSLLGVMQAKSESGAYGGDVNKAAVPVVVSLTAVSAIVGVLVGASKKKYKTVYTNPKFNTGFLSTHVSIGLAYNSKCKGATLRYTF